MAVEHNQPELNGSGQFSGASEQTITSLTLQSDCSALWRADVIVRRISDGATKAIALVFSTKIVSSTLTVSGLNVLGVTGTVGDLLALGATNALGVTANFDSSGGDLRARVTPLASGDFAVAVFARAIEVCVI